LFSSGGEFRLDCHYPGQNHAFQGDLGDLSEWLSVVEEVLTFRAMVR
jgi:hypothetical protein